MTVGTAIVISIGMLCVTFLLTIGIGAILSSRKTKAANDFSKVLTDEITSRLKGNLKK